MGNSCGNGAAARRRVGLMERHTLSEEQIAKLEASFKKSSKGKRYIGFKEFLELYPESELQRDASDMRSVYSAFADTRTNCLKFDGFVMLMLLSNRVGSVDEPERMQALFNVMDPAGCQSVPKAEFRRFVRSVVADDDDSHRGEKEGDGGAAESAAVAVAVSAEASNGSVQNADSDATDGPSDTRDALLGFDEFRDFCAKEKAAYGAICAYVFPM